MATGVQDQGTQAESVKTTQEARRDFATANELTFLVDFFEKLLAHDNRNMKPMSATDKVKRTKQA